MAYNKKKLYEQAQEAIKKNNLFWIEDIVAWLPCDKTTFYRYFKKESNEYNTLKGMLETNKTKTKSAIRAKLFKGNKATELLALYRLIATPEEHKKLNQSYIDHTSKGKGMSVSVLSVDPLADYEDNESTTENSKLKE